MSTNKTPNYNLHSWLPQDEFHVTEINENFTKLDQAVKAEATAAAQKAAALESTLAGKPEIVYGIYTGDGTNGRHFDLGRKPVAVHIEHRSGLRGSVIETYGNLFVQGGTYTNTNFTFDDTGFTLPTYKYLNNRTDIYSYIAFFA